MYITYICIYKYIYIIRRACDKPDKMTEWPWLMIILALISTVQWPNTIGQHTYNYKKYWEEYLRPPIKYNYRTKRSSSLDDQNNSTTTITTTRNTDFLRSEPRSNMKNTSVRTFSSLNVTKSLPKNENTINNSSIQSSNGLKFPQVKSSSSIVFPNSIDEKIQTISTTSSTFLPEQHVIEKCSMNGSFCTKVDNYPRQDLLNIFRTSKFMSTAFFGIDTINDLETRISNTNLQPFCESQEDVIFPEAGINLNNEWRYIVQDPNNDNNNFKQGIRVEKCVNAGMPCKFSDNLPLGYTATCVQKFIYKKLVAIKESKEVYYDNFKLPSCCSCMYSQNPDLLTRKGGDIENRKIIQNSPEPLKKIKEVLKTRT